MSDPFDISTLPPVDEVDQILAERYFDHFVRQAWPIVEPGVDFVDGWHIAAICEHLEAVSKRDIKRLIINIPPRHMKSILTAVMWPAWTWANDPYHKFLFSSYAESLSIRDSVKCRRLIQSPWYQKRWSSKFSLTADQNQKMRFENDHTGYRIATSVDGAATGEGGDTLGVDDPHNVKEALSPRKLENVIEWWDQVMQTRLNNPKTGAIVIIMQRSAVRDLTGHILETDLGYTHLCLPARYEGNRVRTVIPVGNPFKDPRTVEGEPLWPERFGDDELTVLERSMGSYAAAGQLQQRPSPREGGYFKRSWFPVVARAPQEVKKRLRFWDFAATKKVADNNPDYTAGVRMSMDKDRVIYIEHVARFRESPLETEKKAGHYGIMDGPGCSVYMEQEPGSSGKMLVRHFASDVFPGLTFHGERSTGSKESYYEPFAAYAEAGMVRLVEGPWNKAFLDELELVPLAQNDDQADAASKAYRKLIGAEMTARVV